MQAGDICLCTKEKDHENSMIETGKGMFQEEFAALLMECRV